MLGSGHEQKYFIKYFVRTGTPGYLETKQENYFHSKMTQYGGWKLHCFEIHIDERLYAAMLWNGTFGLSL